MDAGPRRCPARTGDRARVLSISPAATESRDVSPGEEVAAAALSVLGRGLQAAADLHDRLRVGAELVRALDLICSRAESVLERTSARLLEMEEADRKLESALKLFEERVDRRSRDEAAPSARLRLRGTGGQAGGGFSA
jgi:hypothetical protein